MSDRFQRAKIVSAFFESILVLSGVPQGSFLGAFLYILYTNELPNFIKSSTISIYADDAKMYKLIESPDDTQALQQDIDALIGWSSAWQLSLNPSKSHVLHIRCLLYTSPSPRDKRQSRMPSSA